MSLRTKIFSAVILSTMIVVALFGYFGLAAVQQSTERTLSERLALARQTASSIALNLDHASEQMKVSAARKVSFADDSTEKNRQFLQDLLEQITFPVHYVAIVDSQLKVRLSEPSNIGPIELRGMEITHVEGATKGRNPSISNVIRDPNFGKQVVYWAVPFLSADGMSGVFEIALNLDKPGIAPLIDQGGLGTTGYIEIIDGKGIVLATSISGQLYKESDHKSLFATLIKDKKTTVSTCHSCHEGTVQPDIKPEIITFAPLANAPWGVVVRQAEEEALEPTRELTQRLAAFGFLAILLALGVAWVTAENLTKTIHRLTTASEKLASGDLSEPVKVNSKDEVGVLGHSLEVMRTRLRISIERIEQRTRELESLNIIASTTSQSLDLETILNTTLDKLIELTDSEAAGILLPDKTTGHLSYRVHRGLSGRFIEAVANLRVGEGIAGRVAETGQSIMVDDISHDPRITRPMVGEEGLGAFISVPLRSRDKVVGVMNFANKTPRKFTDQDLQFLSAIGNQMGVAVENANLYDELQRKEEMRGELLRQVITAQEEERKRIARELHDETSQALAALSVKLEALLNSPNSASEELKGKLKGLQNLATSSLDAVHRLILDLRPSVLDDLGLIPAITWYAETRLQSAGVKLYIETVGTECRLPAKMETALFRIAQEAITNIAEHARAESTSIILEFTPNSIILNVQDDGKGFQLNEVVYSGDRKRGLGLLGMRERTGLLGGNLRIHTEPEKGTSVTVEIPVDWERIRNEKDKNPDCR